MPRSRGTDVPQRPSPRGAPSLRTSSSSNSDPMHHHRTGRSPKLADGRSPRSVPSDPLHQKKLGSRIADLESQLGQAQTELKSLKNQLVSAEAAKKVAQEKLDKKSKKQPNLPAAVEIQQKHSTVIQSKVSNKKECETSDDIEQETDVFEVPIEVSVEPNKVQPDLPAEQNELETKPSAVLHRQNSLSKALASKNNEICLLKTQLDERDKELEVLRCENEKLKVQMEEKSSKISSAESAVNDLTMRLNEATEELEDSKTSAAEVTEKLESTDRATLELENEMKKLRVQTEQWRKAADAAASVLAGEVEEANGRRISERCGSMDKHYSSNVNAVGSGYTGHVRSPGLMDESDDVLGSEKRKSIRVFGDLWKKKGHK